MPDNRGGPELYGYQMPQRMQPRNALGALVGGIIADADQAKFRTQRDAWIEAGAQRLEAIGTPRASQLALKLRDNPAAIHMMVKQRGGWPALEAGLQAEAENMRFSQVMEQNAAGAYSDPSSFVAAMSAAGMDPARAAQVWSTLQPARQNNPMVVPDPTSETGWRYVRPGEATGMEAPPPGSTQGMQVYDAEGNLIFQKGGELRAPQNLQKGTRKSLEDVAREGTEGVGVLKTVMDSYRPEYFTYRKKLTEWGLSTLEKLDTDALTPEQRIAKRRYNHFKGKVFSQLNEAIKRFSGAAVAAHEEVRMKNLIPNLDDAPSDFEGKAEALTLMLSQMTARANYMLQHGLKSPGDIPLWNVEKIMEKRSNELEAAFASQGMPQEQIDASIERALVSEFGVSPKDVIEPDWDAIEKRRQQLEVR